MSVNSCFDYIVGFSRKEDLCVQDDWDDNYAISDSGLYIDELPGMPQRFISSLGGNYDIWEKMENARENAINAFKIDALQEILKNYQPARDEFMGDIGYKTFTALLSSYTYHGLRMFSDIIGGSFILRGVYLMLNVTEWVTLNIYDEYDLLYSVNIQSQADRPKYTAITPISLPLGGNYYFLYSTSGRPYNNRLTCNCGNYRWCFNTQTPSLCMKTSRDRWTQWAMMAGVSGDDLTTREDWGTSREGNGMVLHGDFICDIMGTFCVDDHANWTNNRLDFAIANAIWYKTGEFLSTYVMDSEEVSRRTLLGVEQWNANRAMYNAKYTQMINFIADNFDENRNECLKCRPSFGHYLNHQIL